MEIKTSELSGAALDWAVAQVDGGPWGVGEEIEIIHPGETGPIVTFFDGYFTRECYSPSTDWSQCGPICSQVSRVERVRGNLWVAVKFNQKGEVREYGKGEDFRVAVCRCFVSAELGDTVSVPDELEG